MARSRETIRAAIAHQKRLHTRRRKLLLLASVMAVSAIISAIAQTTPRPQHTSILSRQGLMNEWLRGHPETCYEALGMRKQIFWKLLAALERYGGLRTTKHITSVEKLGCSYTRSA